MIVYSCVSIHRIQAVPQHSQISNVLKVSVGIVSLVSFLIFCG